MVRQHFSVPALMLGAVVVGIGSSAAGAPVQGHGGGPGHALAGPGYYGRGYGYYGRGYGYYGYPGFIGLGLGVGVGYGWGYPYYPYGYGYPVYVDVASGPPPSVAIPPSGFRPSGPEQVPAPLPPGNPTGSGPVRLTDTDMLLSIRVPPDAIVRINGTQTNQNGPRREFMSSGLTPGRSYTFVVTAQWTEPNGQVVELERRIPVQGGERRNVDFTMPSPLTE
jgi:uncharacterized protein (TIGR03000 family)